MQRLRASAPYGEAIAGRHYDRPIRFTAALPSAPVFLAGIWLVIGPYALDYRNTGGEFTGYWNDIVVGLSIAVLALIRMIAPLASAPLSFANVVLRAWLIVAPFALSYNDGVDAPRAAWNDILTGTAVLVLAAASWWAASRGRAGSDGPDR